MSPRFCILLHDDPWWHWDFLLENGDHALCWRLLREPCCGEPIAAEQLPPHRLLYLEFEGPVSGDRGTVRQIERGTYSIHSRQPVLTISLVGLKWARQGSLEVADAGRMFWRFW